MTQRGFTLIEILIALAIIAIACTAIVKAVDDSVAVAANVKERFAATRVIANVFVQLRNGMMPLPNASTPGHGTVTMLNLPLRWQAVLTSDAQAVSPVIDVSVYLPNSKKVFMHMQGAIFNGPVGEVQQHENT